MEVVRTSSKKKKIKDRMMNSIKILEIVEMRLKGHTIYSQKKEKTITPEETTSELE